MLGSLENAILGCLLLTLMVGMGASLDASHFRNLREHPSAAAIGMASQFGWMPLLALGLSKALSLEPEMGFALVVVGCCPGGTTSNMFSYFAKADVALSVAMTSASSLVAPLCMPALLWVYGSSFQSETLQIPFFSILGSLGATLIAIATGMLLRRRNLRLAAKLERSGQLAGATMILLLTSTILWSHHGLLLQLGAAEWTAAAGLAGLGLGLGYAGSSLARLPAGQRRSVCFETGVQNTALGLGILGASFSPDQALRMFPPAIAYALAATLLASLFVVLFRSKPGAPQREDDFVPTRGTGRARRARTVNASS